MAKVFGGRAVEVPVDEDGVQRHSTLNELGQEVPDPVPMAPPIGYRREPTMVERIRAMVRSEHVRLAAEAAGNESFEEADDFDVGDDYDPSSPYEEVFDPVDEEARLRLRQEEYRASVEARSQQLRPVKEKSDGDTSSRIDERGEGSGNRSASDSDRESKQVEGEGEASSVRRGVRGGSRDSRPSD